MDFSLSIGIDKYHNLSDTPYAENDARAFHKIMEETFKVGYSHLLLGNKATYTSILSKVKDIVSRITSQDRFLFFFAGHGANIKSVPYLSCVDSDQSDDDTWINIIEIMERVASAGCNKNLLFIDACESTIKLGSRKITSSFSIAELEKNAKDNFYSCVFSSTSHKGVADVNTVTKHGIWTSFLLKALSGDDEKALTNSLWLTNNSLQNYLSISVKNYCKTKPDISVQNSHIWGKSEGEYIIWKFQKKEIAIYKTLPPKAVNSIYFSSEISENVKKLSGFIKGSHTVPKYKSSGAVDFVNRIANDDIKSHMEATSKELRDLFGLKSKDFNVSYDNGSATFECPYFLYSYSVKLNEDDLSEAIFSAELHPLEIEKLIEYSELLDDCFPQWFDYLIYSLNKRLNIKELILKIEDADDDVLKDYNYDYDSEKTYVSIFNKSLNREIVIHTNKIEIKFQVKETIPNMIEGLKDLSNQLLLVSNDYKLLGNV